MTAFTTFLQALGEGLCSHCHRVLQGRDERASGMCLLCGPPPIAYKKMCAPCGLGDASPLTVLAVRGRCEHCGDNGLTTEGVTLYRCPDRPAPGFIQ